jgi:formylglycine-generating enzyme
MSMRISRTLACGLATLLLAGVACPAMANVFSMGPGLTNLETVPVGSLNNAPDTRYNGIAVGGIGYVYQIGRFDVTSAQYCQFLNAVAKADTYHLYSLNMSYGTFSCGIMRGGSANNYNYYVNSGSENRPVNFVNFWDACRFANWLENGQPSGGQGAATTEDGSYTLNGYTGEDGRTIQRNPDARWVLPSESEWYKAAYHKNDGATGNYWDYATQSYEVPVAEGAPGRSVPPGSANYLSPAGYLFPRGTNDVGAYSLCPGPYGTFDQTGNVAQWVDDLIYSAPLVAYRGARGGSFSEGDEALSAASRGGGLANTEEAFIGFRVALVPEPASMTLLAVWGLLSTRRRSV